VNKVGVQQQQQQQNVRERERVELHFLLFNEFFYTFNWKRPKKKATTCSQCKATLISINDLHYKFHFHTIFPPFNSSV